MSLILKMQINDQSENKYVFSTENGEIELIPLSVIENGEYVPEENQGYNRVTVNVPQIVLEHLNITANGTYESSSGRGYDVVTVNVQPILDILNETISSNGNYVFNPSQDYDGFETVQLTVSVPEPLFEHLSETITSNGTYNYLPYGTDGFDEVEITVNVPAVTPNLQTKTLTITQNGSSVVTPDSGYDGLDEVDITVDVQGGGSLPSYISIDTYTPSENSLGVDVVQLTHDSNSYLVDVYVQIEDSTNLNAGAIVNASLSKRNTFTAPSYQGSLGNSDGGVFTASYISDATYGSHSSYSGTNIIVFGVNPSSSSSGCPITISGSNEIKLYRKSSSDTNAGTRGFKYGKTYRIIGIYSS